MKKRKESNIKFLIPLAILILVTLSLIIFPINYSGKAVGDSLTYYVSLSGSDSNPGTLDKPWKTIQHAANTVNSGTIIVKAGDYTSQGRVMITKSGTESSPVVFMGETGTKVYGFAVYKFETSEVVPVDYIQIKNFEITNNDQDINNGVGITIFGKGCLIENNKIHDLNTKGIYLYADSAGSDKMSNCVVQNNELQNNKLGGIVVEGQNNEIKNNKLHNNFQGVSIYRSWGNKILENEVYLNDDVGIGVSELSSHSNVIENNIVYSNAQKVDDRCGINLYQVGNNNIVRYNKVYSQHDTFNDGSIGPAPENPTAYKIGSCGIRFDGGVEGTTTATGSKIYYNIIYDEYYGIEVYNFANVEAYNNVIYDSSYVGIFLSSYHQGSSLSTTQNTKIKNNIVDTAKNYLIADTNAKNSEINYNIYSTSNRFLKEQSILTFENWKTNTGYDSNSYFEDAKFKDKANADFSLNSGSKAIDSGTNVGLTKDYLGSNVPFNSIVDIGSIEFTSISPPTETCGNGIIEGNEKCDLDNLGGQTCISLGYESGSLKCSSICEFDVSSCYSGDICGDGIIDAGEECDSGNLGGQTCISLGCDGGSLSCSTDCKLVGSQCYNVETSSKSSKNVACEIQVPKVVEPVCNSGQQETRQCGSTDVGVCEYGTETRTCNSEGQWDVWGSCVGAVYPVTEVCGDKLDNDCDGQVDEGCSSSSDPKK
jgi:parallel beta-helix repeat protein